MLIKYFSSNKAGLQIVLLCLAVLLWLKTLLDPADVMAADPGFAGPLGRLLINPLYAFPGISSLLAMIVVLVCGALLVHLNTKHSFLKSKSQFPQLFFIAITGGLAGMRFLSPALASVLFVIILLFKKIFVEKL